MKFQFPAKLFRDPGNLMFFLVDLVDNRLFGTACGVDIITLRRKLTEHKIKQTGFHNLNIRLYIHQRAEILCEINILCLRKSAFGLDDRVIALLNDLIVNHLGIFAVFLEHIVCELSAFEFGKGTLAAVAVTEQIPGMIAVHIIFPAPVDIGCRK